MNRLVEDKKNLVIFLLVGLFFLKIPHESLSFLFWVLGGVLYAAILDFFSQRIFYKRTIFPASAIITGFIVAGVLDYRENWPWLITFLSLAVISKHALKFNKKHIFNPAGFGLFFAALFKVPLTWNIESNIFLIIIAGMYLAYSYKKIFHVLGFLVFFSALFVTQGMNPFGIISWFFIFIMLIEPKTSGYGKLRGFVFGAIAGLSSFIIFKFFPGYDFFICSLFFACLCNPILERIKI
jgi:hypothetical protein